MNIALVTGTTKGIGLSLTELLLQNDFTVLALSRNADKLEHLRRTFNERFDPYSCDISRPEQIQMVFNQISAKYTCIDLLVNNAGIGYFEPLESTTDAHWEVTIQTNLSGPFYVTRAALSLLKNSLCGTIVNICSTASRTGFKNCTAYAASKFGLYGMTEVWREELRSANIRVTAVIPGPVQTPFWNNFTHDFDTTSMMKPESVAQTILWLFRQSPDHVIEEITIKPPGGDL